MFCPKKTKLKDPKLALSHNNMAESPKKNNKKDKKKRFRGQIREYTGEQTEQTPATSINTINVSKKRRKSMTLVRLRVSTAIRKVTLLAIAPSQKTSVGLGNLRAGN